MPRTFACVIAAAAAAACALSGCGPVRMGAAAIVGGQRITAATLNSEVSNLEQAYHASQAQIQLQFPPSQAPQAVLGWMLRFKIRDELAARNHVSVSNGASQRALAAIARQSGRTGSAFTALAVANGIPPDLLPALGRFEAIQNALIVRLDGGRVPTTQTAVAALTAVLDHRQCVAAKSLNIQVNPQFGALDYGSLSIVAAATPLSAPAVAAPKPTATPQLTPQC